MHAVRAGSQGHIDPVVHNEGHAERSKHALDGTRLRDHLARLPALVAQLHERRSAFRHAAREVGQAVPTRVFRIDKCIEAQINTHSQDS